MTTDLAAASRSDWRTTAAEAANRAWYVHRAKNPPPADYPRDMELEFRESGCDMFSRGAAWMFVESSKLAPALASLADLIDWLRSTSSTPQVDLEEVRAAWRAVREWEGPPASREHRNALEEMDILLGLHADGR